jgi:hypothetical protein
VSAPSWGKPTASSVLGALSTVPDAIGPTAAEKISNAETMFGTGSKQHVSAQSKFGKEAAREFTRDNLKLDMTDLTGALKTAYGDSYVTGLLTAAQQTGTPLASGLGQVLPTTDAGWAQFWDAWAPGNIPAGDLLSDGGLTRLLEQADVTIKGIEGSTLDGLGNLLADGVSQGLSVDGIAATMGDFVNNPDRAYLIADTECARSVESASQSAYGAAGVQQWDWLDSPGACEICVGYAADGPYEVGAGPDLPGHPRCRCSSAPRDSGSGSSDDSVAMDSGE